MSTIRYYVDADLLGLARAIVTLRDDFTFAGDPGIDAAGPKTRPPSPIERDTADDQWIPIAANNEWIAITRDRRMEKRPHEVRAIRDSKARLIRLDSPKRAISKWEQLEILMCQWRKIEELRSQEGPWVYVATRTGLRRTI